MGTRYGHRSLPGKTQNPSPMNTTTGKTSLLRLLCPVAALGMLLCSRSVAAAQEPVLGTWQWENSRQDFTLLPDGTAVQNGHAGTWVCTNAAANPRVYQINWERGLVLDTLYLVQGGTQLVGQNQTTYNLRATRTESAPSAAPVAVEVAATEPADYVDQLAEQLPRAKEWVLAPLDTPVPETIRQTFETIDSTLQAEAVNVPAAQVEVYRQGWGVWRDLMAVWHEREAWLHRNYELNHGAGFPESWKTAWTERTRLVETRFAASYTPFHEAARLHPRWAGAGLEGHSYGHHEYRGAAQGGHAFAPHAHALPQFAPAPHHVHAPHAGHHREIEEGHGHRR